MESDSTSEDISPVDLELPFSNYEWSRPLQPRLRRDNRPSPVFDNTFFENRYIELDNENQELKDQIKQLKLDCETLAFGKNFVKPEEVFVDFIETIADEIPSNDYKILYDTFLKYKKITNNYTLTKTSNAKFENYKKKFDSEFSFLKIMNTSLLQENLNLRKLQKEIEEITKEKTSWMMKFYDSEYQLALQNPEKQKTSSYLNVLMGIRPTS